MNLENVLVKGALVIIAGSISAKAVLAYRKYKMEQDLYEQVEEDAEDEK